MLLLTVQKQSGFAKYAQDSFCKEWCSEWGQQLLHMFAPLHSSCGRKWFVYHLENQIQARGSIIPVSCRVLNHYCWWYICNKQSRHAHHPVICEVRTSCYSRTLQQFVSLTSLCTVKLWCLAIIMFGHNLTQKLFTAETYETVMCSNWAFI